MPPSKRGKARKKSGKKRQKKGTSFVTYFLILILLVLAGIIFLYFNRELLDKIPFPGFPKVKTWRATLYFGDESNDALIKEYRMLTSALTPAKMTQALLQGLIAGPYAAGIRTIPAETKIRSVSIEDHGLVKIDFSPEIVAFHPGGSSAELMTVYSIVNTITTNIKKLKKVQFLIDGSPIETIAGHIDCRSPIFPKPELVR